MSDIEQRGQTAASQQMSVGLTAYDPASLPTAVTAGQAVDAISDLYGRQQVYVAGGSFIASGTVTSTNVSSATATSTLVVVAASVSTGTALAANSGRTYFEIQNLNTDKVYVYNGSGVSAGTTFSKSLNADTAVDAGNGGIYNRDYIYKGLVTCAATTGAAIRLAVVEV